MPVVSVSMPTALIERLDEFADEHDYTGRSDAVREATRLLLEEFEDDRLEGRPLAAVVTVLYDFGSRDVDREITRLRHDYEEHVSSKTHSHVGGFCMELFVFEGTLEDASTFVGAVRAISGVRTVDYSLVPLDDVGDR